MWIWLLISWVAVSAFLALAVGKAIALAGPQSGSALVDASAGPSVGTLLEPLHVL